MARRIAVSPLSWGVTSAPGWGYQLAPGRILAEARRLEIGAFEGVPEGYLPVSPGFQIVAGAADGFGDRSRLAAADRTVRMLEAFGAAVLVVSPPPGPLDTRGWASFLDALGALEGICRRSRLELAVQPRFDSALDSQEHLEHFLVGCHHGLCLDVGELLLCGIDPVEVVEFDATRVRHVHLKDLYDPLLQAVRERRLSRWEATFKGLVRPLGEGDAEVPRLLRALDQHRYGGWLVLEQDAVLAVEPPPGEGPYHGLRRSLDFLGTVSR